MALVLVGGWGAMGATGLLKHTAEGDVLGGRAARREIGCAGGAMGWGEGNPGTGTTLQRGSKEASASNGAS